MLNKIDNNCAFKANLQISPQIGSSERLKTIQELFKSATKNYPNETLYLTTGKNNKLLLHTNNKANGGLGGEIFADSLLYYLNNFSDSEISKKFINAFKILRLRDISLALKSSIKDNQEKFFNNTQLAEKMRKLGKDNFADKYEQFAFFNKNKIQNLDIQLNNIKQTFFKQREVSSKELPQIMQLDIK